MNLPHGPNRDDQRRYETRELMSSVYRSDVLPEDVPLFVAHSERIIENLRTTGVVFDNNKCLLRQAWDWFRVNRCESLASGRRTSTCRFMGLPCAIIDHVNHWGLDLFERTYVALELDKLGNRALVEKLKLDPTVAAVEEPSGERASTSKTTTIDEKAVRKCCENALVISVLVLQDDHHYRVAQIMACAAAVLKRWHTDQNKILRCSGGSLKFWTDQVEGGYLTHVNDCLDVLFNMQALHDCGFATDAKEASVVKNDMTAEDEYAALLCDQQRILAGLRMKRHLNTIVGHPRSFLACRKGGRRAQEVCDEFLKDLFCFLPPCHLVYFAVFSF